MMIVMMSTALIGAGTGTLAAAGFLSHAVRGRSSAVFGPSIYRGDRTRPALALTFDDGPSESTPALLEILAEQDVRATFFMCGENVRRCPSVAREVASAGHEIGNHTDSHPRLDFRLPDFIHREMELAQLTIRDTTGAAPRLFRAPFGVRWFGLRRAQRQLDLMGVMWTILGHDWHWPADRVSLRLIQRAINGAVICMHDGREVRSCPDIRATLDAVKLAIPRLKELGFHFETVSQILCPTN
jgi:peptidoglycan/xylan/chitin deacetylase (PgdA/CDA1 family)